MLQKQLKRKQKNEGVDCSFGTFGASLLGNELTGKEVMRSGEGTFIFGQDF